MSDYVGIDVHRKRSQVAVVTGDGTVEFNKNVMNGSEPFLRLIGDLPSGTLVAFEAAFGWGWLAGLLEDYGFDPHLDLPPASREIVTDCPVVIDGLAPVIGRLDGELHQYARADPRVKVLTTLPGVGQFTALVMLAVLVG